MMVKVAPELAQTVLQLLAQLPCGQGAMAFIAFAQAIQDAKQEKSDDRSQPQE